MEQTREVCRYPELRFLPLYFGKIYRHQLYFSKHIIPIDIDSLPDRYANESSPHDDVVAKDTQLLIDMVVESAATTPDDLSHEPRTASQERRDSQRLGIQKKTVENHLNLALKEIKNLIFDDFVTLPLGVTPLKHVLKINEVLLWQQR